MATFTSRKVQRACVGPQVSLRKARTHSTNSQVPKPTCSLGSDQRVSSPSSVDLVPPPNTVAYFAQDHWPPPALPGPTAQHPTAPLSGSFPVETLSRHKSRVPSGALLQ